jgi:hypothetical protein
LHQLSAPYRQDGNGRAERPWRTLGEATVTMLSQSGLPKSFWYYGMAFAVSLANRRGDMSAYEQLRHVKPPIQETAPFGSKVEARIDPSQRRKLAELSHGLLHLPWLRHAQQRHLAAPATC